MEFDTTKCGDYIRGLVLSPQGKAIRKVLCPLTIKSINTLLPEPTVSTAPEVDDDTPPLMDLVVKEVPFAATNRIFTVVNQLGNGGSLIVKCFLPYYRTKPSVILPSPYQSRAKIEYLWNQIMTLISPNKIPTILYFDEEQGIIIYERLETHVTARLELTVGNRYPLLAEDMSIYFSRTLWYTTKLINNSNNNQLSLPNTITSTTPENMKEIFTKIQANLVSLSTISFSDTNNTILTVLEKQLFPLLHDSLPFTNYHTKSTVLDKWETNLRKDAILMNKLQQLSTEFTATATSTSSSSLSNTLIHGDLHTGNILTAILRTKPVESDYHVMRDEQAKFEKMTPEELEAMLIAEAESSTPAAIGDLRIIDSEYSGYGPVGFDIGTYLGNLIIALASGRSKVRAQEALIARGGYAKYTAEKTKERWATHCAELADVLVNFWIFFVSHYIALWDENRGIVVTPSSPHHHDHTNECNHDHSHSNLSSSGVSTDTEWKTQIVYLQSILETSISYIGVEIIRRVLGALHVHDLESLESPTARAATETRLLAFARYCIVNASSYTKQITNLSLQQNDRTQGIRIFSNAFETLVSGIAAMDGENGWIIIDKATPNTIIADDVLFPGRSITRTLVVVDNNTTLSPEQKTQNIQQLTIPNGTRCVLLSNDSKLSISLWDNLILTNPVSSSLASLVRSVWGPIAFCNVDALPKESFENVYQTIDEGNVTKTASNFITVPPHILLLSLETLDTKSITIENVIDQLNQYC